jgi:acetyl esterase/lipase
MSIKLWQTDIPHYNSQFQIGQNENSSALTPYLINDGVKRACVIVFPGGAYMKRSDHEGGPVALWLNSLGINAFVLNYRVAPYKYPALMADAQRAVRFVRYNCEEYGVDPDKLGVLGFSAGGHLACVASALYQTQFYPVQDEIDRVSARPNISVLCYPVVSLLKYVHEETVTELLGSSSSELRESLSGEMIIHADMPPVFLWHTVEDQSVPVEHSIMLLQALRKNKTPVDCHIYNNGGHGLGIGLSPRGAAPVTAGWVEVCAEWLRVRLNIG